MLAGKACVLATVSAFGSTVASAQKTVAMATLAHVRKAAALRSSSSLVADLRYAKRNYVDHRMVDQSSVLRFIEENWGLGTIGSDSSDAKAGRLNGLFDFDEHPHAPRLILDPLTGVVLSEQPD